VRAAGCTAAEHSTQGRAHLGVLPCLAPARHAARQRRLKARLKAPRRAIHNQQRGIRLHTIGNYAKMRLRPNMPVGPGSQTCNTTRWQCNHTPNHPMTHDMASPTSKEHRSNEHSLTCAAPAIMFGTKSRWPGASSSVTLRHGVSNLPQCWKVGR
jgi:hypothetical protein